MTIAVDIPKKELLIKDCLEKLVESEEFTVFLDLLVEIVEFAVFLDLLLLLFLDQLELLLLVALF